MMHECVNRHPKVSSPLLSMHLCKTGSSSVEEESRENNSEEQTLGSDGRPLFEPKGLYFPSDSHETDDRAKRVLADPQRQQKSRVQNPSLLI
jgi:hypothetical protein